MSRASTATLASAFSDAFGEYNSYRVVWRPYDDVTPVVACLADDLADLYRDLKNGLMAIGAGTPGDAVGAEWRISFEIHLGRHAANALSALHAALYAH